MTDRLHFLMNDSTQLVELGRHEFLKNFQKKFQIIQLRMSGMCNSTLLKVLALLLTVTMTTGFTNEDFDNADTEDEIHTGCDPGYVINQDNTCQTCYSG